MEELFQYMKKLRSQINDAADQAANMSVEEHMQCTTIQTLQKDLDSVKNASRQVKEETVKMSESKGKVCSQILEKQRKIGLLESDSFTLNQTLELVQQEKLSLSMKLSNQSAYYKMVGEDLSGQLKEQQEQVNGKTFGRKELQDGADHKALKDIQAAQAKLNKMKPLTSNLVLENAKLRHSVDLVKKKMNDIKPEVSNVDKKTLEQELQALLSDKTAESEYVHSLQLQITRLKDISHTVKCACGKDYNVKLELLA